MLLLTDYFFKIAAPLGSPFPALATALLLPVFGRRMPGAKGWLAMSAVVAGCYILHVLLALDPGVARWLARINSPVFMIYMVLVLPAIHIRNKRWRRVFLLLPAMFVLATVLAIFRSYRLAAYPQQGFYWFIAPASYVMTGIVSALILVQPFCRVQTFRIIVKSAAFLLLIYGGFAFRQSFSEYREMLSRRSRQADLFQLAETSPAVGGAETMLHLPSAPCRFSADGGYVQGCNLELLQRLMQVDYRKALLLEVEQSGALAVALGSLFMFFALCFLAGRWFCGWVCPLHSLGAPLDWLRRRLGLPHFKLSRRAKTATFGAGIGFASIGLIMARLYPSLDAEGAFAGCKIPIYPFCKICPGQQICPVAASGPAMYSGLPSWDWGFGFFRIAIVTLLVFFALSYAMGRRWWCRFCPMGMLSGLFNRGAALTLAKDPVKCNRCGVCADVCPMDIETVLSDMRHRDVGCFDCVYCLKCIEKCPRDGCLSFEYTGKTLTTSRFE